MNAKHPPTGKEPHRKRPAPDREPELGPWERKLLLFLVLGWIAVFLVALYIKPYEEDGTAMLLESHRQLGLPPCNFYQISGYPCPFCGMTTSFALMIRGDLINSAKANWAGTLLATMGILFIPWSIASIGKGRLLGIKSAEWTFTLFLLLFLSLVVFRWCLVVLKIWLNEK